MATPAASRRWERPTFRERLAAYYFLWGFAFLRVAFFRARAVPALIAPMAINAPVAPAAVRRNSLRVSFFLGRISFMAYLQRIEVPFSRSGVSAGNDEDASPEGRDVCETTRKPLPSWAVEAAGGLERRHTVRTQQVETQVLLYAIGAGPPGSRAHG